MWFRNADKDVVLIDITGGTEATVTEKVANPGGGQVPDDNL